MADSMVNFNEGTAEEVEASTTAGQVEGEAVEGEAKETVHEGEDAEGEDGEKLFAGKFKTVEDLEKGYREATKKFREAKPEVPESYDVSELGIEEDDPVFSGMADTFKEAGLTQEQVASLTKKWQELQEADSIDPEAEKQKLGKEGERAIQNIQNFFAKNKSEFTEQELKEIEASMVTAESVQAMNKLIGLMQGKNIPTEAASEPQRTAQEYLQDAQDIFRQPNFHSKPELQREYQRLMDEYAKRKVGHKD